jgi:sarcosine oxidase
VVVLERFAIGHDRGSSHGLTRIIRLAYFEHPSYVPLLRRAFELWRDLERGSGELLLHITGGLDVGAPGSVVFEGSLRSCHAHQLPHEVLTGAELRRRFPAWRIGDTAAAVFQPDGGFLLSERCIQAHAGAARRAGAVIREHEPVLSWHASGGRATVRTERGIYEAGQLVLAAGAWMGALLPELSGLMSPERQVLAWFDTGASDEFAAGRFPVFVHEAAEGMFYGFPVFEALGFKIGRYHHLGGTVDPDALDRACHPADEAALRAAVARYFPAANGAVLRTAVCMFTNTPDEHFIIDRHPSMPEVLVVSPCSGHGFKFCSVVGEIVADLVTADRTRHDISAFRLERFKR